MAQVKKHGNGREDEDILPVRQKMVMNKS